MKKTNLLILASGNGSNAENLVHYFDNHAFINIVGFASNNKRAYIIERAKRLNKLCFVFSKEEFNNGSFINRVKRLQIDFIVLAGFLLKVPKNIIDMYPNKIINIHPSLLPKYGGDGMYGRYVHEAVLKNKEKISGITIHIVNENYDEGLILFQDKCTILPEDNSDTLAQKVHKLEYHYYPLVIEKFIQDSK